jgi:hypothetical protein
VLIVRSFTAEAKGANLGGNPRSYAHVVALCPTRMRKEHTSTKPLDCVLEWWAEALPPRVLYPSNFPIASDRGHFIGSAGLLV